MRSRGTIDHSATGQQAYNGRRPGALEEATYSTSIPAPARPPMRTNRTQRNLDIDACERTRLPVRHSREFPDDTRRLDPRVGLVHAAHPVAARHRRFLPLFG